MHALVAQPRENSNPLCAQPPQTGPQGTADEATGLASSRRWRLRCHQSSVSPLGEHARQLRTRALSAAPPQPAAQRALAAARGR
eukprot:scaffold5321_cov366-Prasinococcus_capsulatus_cf.AAC.7